MIRDRKVKSSIFVPCVSLENQSFACFGLAMVVGHRCPELQQCIQRIGCCEPGVRSSASKASRAFFLALLLTETNDPGEYGGPTRRLGIPSISRGFRQSLRKKVRSKAIRVLESPVTLVTCEIRAIWLDAPYNQQHNCERPHKNGWRKVAGFLMCRSAAGRHGGSSSPFLRFPIVRRAGWDAVACRFSQHYAMPDLLDGAIAGGHRAVHWVLCHLPPSPPDLASADASAVLSRVLSAICTSSSYSLALSMLSFLGFPEK
jgi:hypothetical protein